MKSIDLLEYPSDFGVHPKLGALIKFKCPDCADEVVWFSGNQFKAECSCATWKVNIVADKSENDKRSVL